VLKCGGGKALTKHASDEAALKAHITPEEANKIIESTVELVCNEALVICGAHVNSEPESEPEVMPVEVRVMQRLYDLEPSDGPEKPLKIDLDLYQMENY
jgi:hypothetical protein